VARLVRFKGSSVQSEADANGPNTSPLARITAAGAGDARKVNPPHGNFTGSGELELELEYGAGKDAGKRTKSKQKLRCPASASVGAAAQDEEAEGRPGSNRSAFGEITAIEATESEKLTSMSEWGWLNE
jgi:hypothetical protein